MGIYVQSPIPPRILAELLEENWSDMQGNLPRPNIILVNDPEWAPTQDVESEDVLFISTDTRGETETLRNAWAYRDIKFDVLVEIKTMEGRQRLFDLIATVRKLIHTNTHNSSTTHYQVLRYGGATELAQSESNIWSGTVRVSFESSGVILDVV